MSDDLDLDPDHTVYIHDFTPNGSRRKLHTDSDCKYVKRLGDSARVMDYSEYKEIFDFPLCAECDPDYEIDHKNSRSGSKSFLERAIENGEVPDDVMEADM